jgi:hypothetical protein
VSDYCSSNLPKYVWPDDVLSGLSVTGAKLLRAQQPLPIVWQEMRGYQHRPGFNEIEEGDRWAVLSVPCCLQLLCMLCPLPT